MTQFIPPPRHDHIKEINSILLELGFKFAIEPKPFKRDDVSLSVMPYVADGFPITVYLLGELSTRLMDFYASEARAGVYKLGVKQWHDKVMAFNGRELFVIDLLTVKIITNEEGNNDAFTRNLLER